MGLFLILKSQMAEKFTPGSNFMCSTSTGIPIQKVWYKSMTKRSRKTTGFSSSSFFGEVYGVSGVCACTKANAHTSAKTAVKKYLFIAVQKESAKIQKYHESAIIL